jgi:hypothetical protein
VPGQETRLAKVVEGAHAAVLMVAHRPYRDLDLLALREQMACPVLVDGRHIVDATAAARAGFTYVAVGVAPARAATPAETAPARTS